MEVILTRVHIGHIRLTHGHLVEGRPAPYCGSCSVPLTGQHIITESLDYSVQRIRHFSGCTNMIEVLGEKSIRKV